MRTTVHATTSNPALHVPPFALCGAEEGELRSDWEANPSAITCAECIETLLEREAKVNVWCAVHGYLDALPDDEGASRSCALDHVSVELGRSLTALETAYAGHLLEPYTTT